MSREVIIKIFSEEEILQKEEEVEILNEMLDNKYSHTKLVVSPYENMGDLIRCKDCKHLDVINSNAVYARCKKHGIEFLPFEDDTKKCFCSWAERTKEQ